MLGPNVPVDIPEGIRCSGNNEAVDAANEAIYIRLSFSLDSDTIEHRQ